MQGEGKFDLVPNCLAANRRWQLKSDEILMKEMWISSLKVTGVYDHHSFLSSSYFLMSLLLFSIPQNVGKINDFESAIEISPKDLRIEDEIGRGEISAIFSHFFPESSQKIPSVFFRIFSDIC